MSRWPRFVPSLNTTLLQIERIRCLRQLVGHVLDALWH